MKKIVAVICLIFMSLTIFATNGQTLLPVDSTLAHKLNILFTSQGLVDFPQSGPWSVDEIQSYLDRVQPQSEVDKALYDSIVNELKDKYENPPVVDLDLELALETYLHSNLNNVGRENWLNPFIKQNPPISAKFNFFINDHIYLFSDVFIGNHYKLDRKFGSNIIDTNLLLNTKDLNTAMPYRTFVSVGGENWNLFLGRDRFYFGSGITGSMILGDNFPFQNALRLNFFKDNFKYTFFSSFYPHPDMYEHSNQNDDFTGIFMYMLHRFEYAIVKNFSFTITEGILYQNDKGFLDLAIYNPMALFHSFFIRGNSNSILSVDLNYAPIKNMNLWLQVTVDELGLGSSDELHNPNAVGVLFGGRYTYDVATVKGVSSFEIAYTDPYMYLRDCPGKEWGFDFVGAYREHTTDAGAEYHKAFLGYQYGNDSVVASIKQEFIHPLNYKAIAQLTYIADGEMNEESKWSEVTNPIYSPSGNARHSLILSFSGDYSIFKNLSLYSKLDIPIQIVPDVKFDTQFSLGIIWKAF